MKTDMTLFDIYKTHRIYDDTSEAWGFSVMDIIQVLNHRLKMIAA